MEMYRRLARCDSAAEVRQMGEELADVYGLVPEEVQTVLDLTEISVLAGALGNYVDPYSAMRIGLLPQLDPGLIVPIGNAASTGASMVLLCKHYWRMANELVDFIEHVELSSRLDFNEYFIANMDFPRENLPDFRSPRHLSVPV